HPLRNPPPACGQSARLPRPGESKEAQMSGEGTPVWVFAIGRKLVAMVRSAQSSEAHEKTIRENSEISGNELTLRHATETEIEIYDTAAEDSIMHELRVALQKRRRPITEREDGN